MEQEANYGDDWLDQKDQPGLKNKAKPDISHSCVIQRPCFLSPCQTAEWVSQTKTIYSNSSPNANKVYHQGGSVVVDGLSKCMTVTQETWVWIYVALKSKML